jgi:peptide/nickel transport system permease protein
MSTRSIPDTAKHVVENTKNNLVTGIKMQLEILQGERLGQAGLVILGVFILIAMFAPWIAPYGPYETVYVDGEAAKLASPSAGHPLGTTLTANDVFSQFVWGARVSLIVGILAAFISVGIGTTIGMVSAYYGGYVDDAFMRLTDIAYGIPFLPFMIVLVALLDPSIWNVIFAISIILWRATARVVRSEVLSLKERPYIESAEASGASDLRIMAFHLFPNVMPVALLYTAFTVAWATLAEANLSFIGFGDPERVSWGGMIFTAYSRGAVREGLWWVVPPGIAITLLVMSWFFIGRAYEKVANPELEAA